MAVGPLMLPGFTVGMLFGMLSYKVRKTRPAVGILRSLVALAVCIAVGALFSIAHVPLPWMLGPLIAMAVMRLSGSDAGAVKGSRQSGQVVLGATLGLYFTPAVMVQVLQEWPFLLASTLVCVVVAIAGAQVVRRVGRVDGATAFFSSVPGGALEMSNLAEQHGARVDLVAAAQSLRILLVVSVVPPVFAALGLHGTDLSGAVSQPVRPVVTAVLLICCGIGAWTFFRMGVPNAWMLGSLAASVAGSVAGLAQTTLPVVLVNGAQIMIGMSLGARFDRGALMRARQFTAAIFLSGLLMLALTGGFAMAWAFGAGLPVPSVVLATAPGGLAEMCLTAKVLHFAVPLVTAAHVTRIVILVSTTGLLFKWSRRLGRARL